MTALPTSDSDETMASPPPKEFASRRASRQPATITTPTDHDSHDTQCEIVGGDSNSQQATSGSMPNEITPVGSNVDSTVPMVHAGSNEPHTHGGAGMVLFDPLLSTLASGLDDIEKVRIAQGNRYRQLTRTGEDKDGEERGFGLDANHPAVAALDGQLAKLVDLETAMAKALAKQLKSHPLHPWIKAQCGLGDKQVARLLAAIRDPYWNDLHGRPRTVSELWAFCGLHVLPVGHLSIGDQTRHASGAKPAADQMPFGTQTSDVGGSKDSDTDQTRLEAQSSNVGVAPRRKRGQKANWSTDAKTRIYLIAESCMKNRNSPYRKVYDDGRAKYAESVHAVACAPCAALPGAPLRDGHKHARAMRLVMKAVLRDLWIESRRLYEVVQT